MAIFRGMPSGARTDNGAILNCLSLSDYHTMCQRYFVWILSQSKSMHYKKFKKLEVRHVSLSCIWAVHLGKVENGGEKQMSALLKILEAQPSSYSFTIYVEPVV